MDKRIVFLNGEFLPITEAKISVLDRGFLFGDGVYEVIPVYSGKILGLEGHLKRLQNSLNAIYMDYKVDNTFFANIFVELLKKNNALVGDYSIYLEITRGAPKERTHNFPVESVAPTIFAMLKQLKSMSYEELLQGKNAVTAEDVRWKNCHIKSISLLPTVLLYQKAFAANAIETILIRSGAVIEGTMSNVFIVKDGAIITPPLTRHNLSGVTRSFIFKIAEEYKMSILEKKIKVSELRSADEIWVSSSPWGIVPIIQLDGKPVKDGRVGKIWQKVIKFYLEMEQKKQ